MNKTLSTAIVVIAGLVLTCIVFWAGLFVGRLNLSAANFGPMNRMGQYFANRGYSMMANRQNRMGGYGMMGYSNNQDCGSGGMMGGGGMMRGSGMVGACASSAATNTKPLTVDQARLAVEGYLKNLNNADLQLKEIMIFNNNAYARITEKSTGIGAMELLVDNASQSVFPEYGPNMMWNLKYSHMSGNGMMGGWGGMMGGRGMMGGYNNNPGSVSADMPITPEKALQAAQEYLDQQLPGYKTAADADPFYGYYTIDILKDGKPAGMLSVNGFSGQVFLHTWHDTYIETSE
jgi:hypothetical protein